MCLVGITPSNNPGTKRELLPYMVMGKPTGHGIQFQGMGILLIIWQRSALGKQLFRPSEINVSLDSCLQSMEA